MSTSSLTTKVEKLEELRYQLELQICIMQEEMAIWKKRALIAERELKAKQQPSIFKRQAEEEGELVNWTDSEDEAPIIPKKSIKRSQNVSPIIINLPL